MFFAEFELASYDHRVTILMICVTGLLRLWKVSWFDAVHICSKLLIFTWMLVVIFTINKQYSLVAIGQKWCKVHALIGRKMEISGTFVPVSPRAFFPWLQYSSTTLLTLHDSAFFLSQVVVGISCSFLVFFVSVIFVTGPGN